jgi:hypothetical protein
MITSFIIHYFGLAVSKPAKDFVAFVRDGDYSLKWICAPRNAPKGIPGPWRVSQYRSGETSYKPT